jgi:hypothetical protein
LHKFIFSPGAWEGEGVITFSMAEDTLPFKTQWTVLPEEEGEIFFSQSIEIDGLKEKMRNQFCIFETTEAHFEIRLENHLVGKVVGKGVIDSKVIAWEFRDPSQEFEGFEIYELQRDGTYQMRAEFTSGEGFRTTVRGTIAPK